MPYPWSLCGVHANSSAFHLLRRLTPLRPSRTRSAQSGDRVYVPGGKVYQVVGCIQGVNLTDVVFSVDGGLRAVANYSTWANETGDSGTEYFPLIQFSNCNNLTLTAAPATTATDGVIEGNGIPWWNRWIFGDHKGLKRPKLVIITASRNIVSATTNYP